MTKDFKQQTMSISLSSIITLMPVLIAVWFIIKPTIIDQVRVDIQAEIEKTLPAAIEAKTDPIKEAFKATLRGDIRRIRILIARFEYEKSTEPQKWSRSMAGELESMKIDLQSMEQALRALQQ